MTKFLNKNEQVYDLKLTSYGHYLLSIGTFKPVYYAFYDDNVIYDGAYAAISESQNNIHKRIKEETPYVESFVLFRDLEDTIDNEGASSTGLFDVDLTPTKTIPAADTFKINRMIGDAWLDGETNQAPAWKIVSLEGNIDSSQGWDNVFSSSIPQINITLRYILGRREQGFTPNPETVGELESTTQPFIDGDIIYLESDDALIYIEEVNTQLLTKNFDIEVFVTGAISDTGTVLERKYFQNTIPQIENGLMMSRTPQDVSPTSYTTSSVEYYFDVLLDHDIDQAAACMGADIFNKQSYYVDLDFDCDTIEEEFGAYDIYGAATEPEICLD